MENKLIQPLYLSIFFLPIEVDNGIICFRMSGNICKEWRADDDETQWERDEDDVRQKSWRVFELRTLNLHIIPQIFKPLGEQSFCHGSYSIKLKIFKICLDLENRFSVRSSSVYSQRDRIQCWTTNFRVSWNLKNWRQHNEVRWGLRYWYSETLVLFHWPSGGGVRFQVWA